MTSDLLTLTDELSGLAGMVEVGYDDRDLVQVRTHLDEIQVKALHIQAIVDSDALSKSRSGAEAWLTARSAEDLFEQSSKVEIDWDRIGACVSFLQSGIDQLAKSLTR